MIRVRYHVKSGVIEPYKSCSFAKRYSMTNVAKIGMKYDSKFTQFYDVELTMQIFQQIKIYVKPVGWCSETAHLENTINHALSQYHDCASMLLWQCRAESVLKGQGYEKYYGYGWIGYYHPTHKCYVQIQKNSDKLILFVENEPILG